MQPSTCFTGTSSIIGANYKLTKLEIIHYFVISLERKVSLISYVEGIAFSESNENLFQEVSPPNTFFFLGGKNFIKKFSRMIGGGCRCVGSAPTLGSSLDTWKLGRLEARILGRLDTAGRRRILSRLLRKRKDLKVVVGPSYYVSADTDGGYRS